MVTTDDPDLADICRKVRHQGEQSWGNISRVGYNYRMTALQAAIGREQLQKLDGFNATRVQIASLYTEHLSGLGLDLPEEAPYAKSVCHVYSFLIPNELAAERDAIVDRLQRLRVPVSVAYPRALYQSPVFDQYEVQPCPVTENVASRVLTLPTAPSIPVDVATQIAQIIVGVLREYQT